MPGSIPERKRELLHHDVDLDLATDRRLVRLSEQPVERGWCTVHQDRVALIDCPSAIRTVPPPSVSGSIASTGQHVLIETFALLGHPDQLSGHGSHATDRYSPLPSPLPIMW